MKDTTLKAFVRFMKKKVLIVPPVFKKDSSKNKK